MRIPGLQDIDARALAKATVREYFADDMPTYAAALSYHVFFALFPFLIFLLALLSFLDIGGLFEWLTREAGRVLPSPAFEQVMQVVGEVHGRAHGGLLSFGIVTAIWLASTGIRSTMGALNRAYDVPEGRPTRRRYFLSLVYTVALGVLIAAATAMMVIGPQLTEQLSRFISLDELIRVIWSWIRVPVAMVLIMIAVSLTYHFAPNRSSRFRLVTPGSVLAVGLWVVAALAFSVYVSNFARYSVTYGSVGAIIVLLLYIFISASVLLLGAEANAEIERQRSGGGEGKMGIPPSHEA